MLLDIYLSVSISVYIIYTVYMYIVFAVIFDELHNEVEWSGLVTTA